MNGELNINDYVMITPCKNEGVNLPSLINSVVSQSIEPMVWVIVDDGSTDETSDIIVAAKEKYSWIQYIRLDEGARDLGLHLSGVIKTGFDYATSYCKENNIDYTYLVNVDADLTFGENFFDDLIDEFNNDSKLGIASGGTKNIIDGKVVHAKISVYEPSGGDMMLRRECFDDCLGIPISYAWDSVLKAKARIKGWKTMRFEKIISTESRDVNSVGGYWKGYVVSGKKDYFLNLHPFHVIFKSIKYSLKKPYYIGVIYILSYFKDTILGKKQINDNEIKEYFWNKWKESIKYRIQKID